MDGKKAMAGAIHLGLDALSWKGATQGEQVSIPLQAITSTRWATSSVSPFHRTNRCYISQCDASAIVFEFPWSARGGALSGSTAALEFDRLINTAITTARATTGTPAAATAATAATATPASATPATVPKAARRTPIRLSKCVAAGRELYKQLQKVGRLSHDRKQTESAELLASLQPPPAPTDLRAEALEADMARKRARALRDFTFTFGGLSLTRQVMQRFLEIREVRMLLPEALQKRQRDADEAETASVLLSVAKDFFGSLMKAKGRRCDIQRNAFGAGLVALIPRDIFENRQGRAAMRLLGLSYRQVKLGSEERAVMEDCGKGFQLWKGGTRKDKVCTALTSTAPQSLWVLPRGCSHHSPPLAGQLEGFGCGLAL